MKRIDRSKLPCKYGCHFTDSVPIPFGSGNCSMPGFDCTYSGDTVIPDELVCEENKNCPAYEPVPVFVCKKHQEEYFDVCSACKEEMWGLNA